MFETGYATTAQTVIPWSRQPLAYGVTKFPDAADFHVSVNGITKVEGGGNDYTVTGGGTTSGSIVFNSGLSDGDFYMITTDGHKTQGIPAVNIESIHSSYYNTITNPGNPITPWVLEDNFRWPSVHRLFIRNCDFWQDDTDGNDRVALVDGTLPHRPYADANRHFNGVPAGFSERMMTFVTGCTTWNFDGTWADVGAFQVYSIPVGTNQFGGELFRMADGAAPTLVSPSKSQLPDWWLTFDDAPERILT